MKSRTLKSATVVLVLLTMVSIGFLYGFTSYNAVYTANVNSVGGNGTIIAVVALDSVNVNGQIQLQWEGPPGGSTTIILQNGTQYVYNHSTVYLQNGTHYVLNGSNNEMTLRFHFSASHFTGQMSVEGGTINESLSPTHPIDSGSLSNVSLGYYQNYFPQFITEQGTNYFAIYIENSVFAKVTVEGAAL